MKYTKYKSKQVFFFILALLCSVHSYAHWSTKGPYGGTVTCFAVGDTNMYVGTADGGVYRSVNQQFISWKYFNYTGLTSGKITAITAIGHKTIAATSDDGVFVSSDAGATWTVQNSGLTNLNVRSLITMGSNIFAGTNGGGVFLSSDSGITWTPMNIGLTTMTISSFAVSGANLYAGTTGGGVFMSVNSAASWSAVNIGLTDMNINAMIVSGNSIFAATNSGVFSSGLVTTSWNPVNTGLGNTNVNGLTASSGFVFAATNGGVFTTSDAVLSWTSANTGLVSDTINAIAIYGTTLFAGTKNSDIYKATTLSLSWSMMNLGLNNLETYALYNSGMLVIGATNKGVFVSRDLAATYVPSNNGLTDSLHVNYFAFAGSVLYAATQYAGVFMSNDTGTTWIAVNTGLTTMNIKTIISSSTMLIAAGANGSVHYSLLAAISWAGGLGLPGGITPTSLATNGTQIFLGTNLNGVFKTNDGITWSAENTGLTNMNVTSLVVLGNDVYAGTNGGGVFKSPVASVSWTASNNGLPTLNITSLCVSGQYVVAGYRGGVYATFDNANSWLPTNIMLYIPEYADVTAISFTPASTRIFVATPFNSYYSNSIAELPNGILEQQQAQELFSILPNPNNGEFQLSFIDQASRIESVSIYNTVGELVQVIAQPQQNFKLTYPAGLYFIKVETSTGTSIQRMVIE